MSMEGNIPAVGFDGVTISNQISDLDYNGCQRRGSVSLSGDNYPNAIGILMVNCVTTKGCNGLCNGIYQDSTS